jgi:hypothetical protein
MAGCRAVPYAAPRVQVGTLEHDYEAELQAEHRAPQTHEGPGSEQALELLFVCFHIMRACVMLNDMGMLEFLLAPANFARMLMALEYDPELPRLANRHNFRQMFKE